VDSDKKVAKKELSVYQERTNNARDEIPGEVGGGVGVDRGGHCLEHLLVRGLAFEAHR
jgi:hypothetical protein